ncbi:MAG: 3-deoxy-D-manno-octulosonic acid transferase [Desulfarculus sp.]|nr:3-deoxy-D-manno-octulosonic acid transferase [Desulfarculus sp.]
MDPGLLMYNLVALPAWGLLPAVGVGLGLAGRWGEIGPRLGLYRHLAPAGPGPRVWLQAVSVGEVGVAQAVAEELWRLEPRVELTVSASTVKGLERARQVLGQKALVAPFPLEAPWAVAAAWQRLRPQVYASLETEIWPNQLAWFERRGTALLLLNGRLSPRSFPRYQKVRPLVAAALRRFRVLSMISPEDARRAVLLGAPAQRVRVDGNAKYAGLTERARPELLAGPAAMLALGGRPLLVAGSARSGEEGPVLEAFQEVLASHPMAMLAVAPRHVERAPRWLLACAQRGLLAQRWTELSSTAPRREATQVVVVDVMGQLLGLYGLAKAAFLGASLVPLGGQNPMEPAAWGVPCLYGPSMEDFADAAQALAQAGAGQTVSDGPALARAWREMLDHPAQASAQGQAGRRVVAAWSGAAATAASLIVEQLDRQGAL